MLKKEHKHFLSMRRQSIFDHNLPNISISLTLHNTPDDQTSCARMTRVHLLSQMSRSSQVCLEEARSNCPDPVTRLAGEHIMSATAYILDTIILQPMVPIQHKHIQCRLATSVPNRLKVLLCLRPASRKVDGREVLLASLDLVCQASDEDEARVGGLQEERHQCVGEDVCAGNICVVG